MNYIFSDNIRIFYLSCYVKSPKATVKLSKRVETSVVLIVFDCVLLEVRGYKLYKHKCCYCFLPSLNMNQVPENYILVSDQIQQNIIRSMQCDCSNRTSAG